MLSRQLCLVNGITRQQQTVLNGAFYLQPDPVTGLGKGGLGAFHFWTFPH